MRVILFLLLTSFTLGDEYPEKAKTYTVYINYPDYSVRANVLSVSEKIRAKDGHTYYWYANNDIKHTDGGFDGKLLHGEYKSFYPDLNLKEQGNFCRGLKTGEWTSWFPDGRVHTKTHYKNGLQEGRCEAYNEKGQLMLTEIYKRGKRNGKTIIYKDQKADSIIIFKKDRPLPPPSPKPSRVNKKATVDTLKNDGSKIQQRQSQDTAPQQRKSRLFVKKEKAPAVKKATDDPEKKKAGGSEKTKTEKPGEKTPSPKKKKKSAAPSSKEKPGNTAH